MSRLPAFLLVVALALLPGCASQPETGQAEPPPTEGVTQVEPLLIRDLDAARRFIAEVHEIRAEAEAILTGYRALMDDDESAFTEEWTEAAKDYRERSRVLAAKARSIDNPEPFLFDDIAKTLHTMASAFDLAERNMADGIWEQDLADMFYARRNLGIVDHSLVLLDSYLGDLFEKAPELLEAAESDS